MIKICIIDFKEIIKIRKRWVIVNKLKVRENGVMKIWGNIKVGRKEEYSWDKRK